MGIHSMIHVQLIIILLGPIFAATGVAAVSQPGPYCASQCGDLTFPFPFGTSSNCYLNESFLIDCVNINGTLVPSLPTTGRQILDISLDDGSMRVSFPPTRTCFNLTSGSLINDSSGNSTSSFYSPRYSLSQFRISTTRNKFTAVGCATNAVMYGYQDKIYAAGCVSLCDNVEDITDGSCSGDGCCHAAIPEGVQDFQMSLTGFELGNRSLTNLNSCSHAFVVEDEAYKFSSSDFISLRGSFPVVLDWAVGNETCEEAQNDQSSYACRGENIMCVNSTNPPGYRCNCSPGYEGNPYLLSGCQNIDECQDPMRYCGAGIKCEDTIGSYKCSCKKGHHYNADTKTCQEHAHGLSLANIALIISMSLLVLLVASSLIFWMLQKRKLMKLRGKFFQQNGGYLLKQHIAKHRGSMETAIIFTKEDLKKATNNYDESRVIGQGGFGTVYKGVLPDNREVAIKKSKISDQSQIEQFINEVVILSQINHRNVVKLIGCCLETEVPLLVYEFITNGTLSDHIHNKSRKSSLSWEMRLKIAAEAAGALSYLHSATSTPIIHRDIKSTNILLDDNYTTKVADFGASRLIPLDKSQLTTLVQGTLGYLDPEYFHSSQLTEKSDVYSFGVLLAELLTGQKALSFDRPENARNLAMYFVSSVIEDRLLEIIDERLLSQGKIEQLQDVAMLVRSCLRVKGEDRPTMKEVAMELEGLRMTGRHPWVNVDLNTEESEHLLNDRAPTDAYSSSVGTGSGTDSTTSGYDSMRHQIIVPLEFR